MINPLERVDRAQVSFERGDIVIACEGFDECAVVTAMTRGWKRRPKIGTATRPPGETARWEDEFSLLRTAIQKDEISGIGCVFDAEDKRKACEARLIKLFASIGLAGAVSASVKTASIESRRVSFGFVINPPEGTGSLDSLFRRQIEATPEWKCLQSLLTCYENHGIRHANPDKVLLRSLLAARRPENTGLNVAINARVVSCAAKEFEALDRFLRALRDTCWDVEGAPK